VGRPDGLNFLIFFQTARYPAAMDDAITPTWHQATGAPFRWWWSRTTAPSSRSPYRLSAGGGLRQLFWVKRAGLRADRPGGAMKGSPATAISSPPNSWQLLTAAL
jgi:hypothetical protein